MSAEITVGGSLKVKSLKARFHESFGVGIRIYNGARFADEEATLASIRVDMEGAKAAKDFSVHGRTLVGNVEKQFLEAIGVKIQIENAAGALADNSVTLGSLKPKA